MMLWFRRAECKSRSLECSQIVSRIGVNCSCRMQATIAATESLISFRYSAFTGASEVDMIVDEKSGVAKNAGCRITVGSGKWCPKQLLPKLLWGPAGPFVEWVSVCGKV